MKDGLQLEFNLDGLCKADLHIQQMQAQIDTMSESIGKVRRKLFAELGEVKKLCAQLAQENADLKAQMAILHGRNEDWLYLHNEELFATK